MIYKMIKLLIICLFFCLFLVVISLQIYFEVSFKKEVNLFLIDIKHEISSKKDISDKTIQFFKEKIKRSYGKKHILAILNIVNPSLLAFDLAYYVPEKDYMSHTKRHLLRCIAAKRIREQFSEDEIHKGILLLKQFGKDIRGIHQASEFYFSKKEYQLTNQERCMLYYITILTRYSKNKLIEICSLEAGEPKMSVPPKSF